jgi:uncharacterized protein YheU (UPF0270 family)
MKQGQSTASIREPKTPYSRRKHSNMHTLEHHPLDDVPPGIATIATANILKEGEDLGISVEDQLKLHVARIKNHLQKQRHILVAKRQQTIMQARVIQLIVDVKTPSP